MHINTAAHNHALDGPSISLHDPAEYQRNIRPDGALHAEPQGVELDTFPTGRDHSEIARRYTDAEGSDFSYVDEDEFTDETDDGVENAQLLGEGSDRQRKQMKRRGRGLSKRRSSPSLTISTGPNGHAANGSMPSQIEMRRKDATISPSSEAHAARVMAQSSFSLDDEPPTPQTPKMKNTGFLDLPEQDRRNFLLLCLLYFLQGVPMGLAQGSVPFLLKPYLSYGQIGVFSLASYPYSLKLLWSPIVDAVWSTRFGRRKTWITPIQLVSGLAMVYLGTRIEEMMTAAGANGGAGVWGFTWWWFLLVFFCATQDIAVDGWAITLLSPQNISYASTAQTVGLTAGHFLSYTVFLAFNSKGLLSLGTYLTFWGWTYIIVTIGLAVLKKEDKTKERDSIMDVYRSMWSVLKLKNIQTIIMIHLIAKIGFQANDAVTSLKLLDKGFGTDNMALVVLIDFPFEIGLGYYAGQWATEYTPMKLWCWAFVGRLIAAVVAQATVMVYPSAPEVPTWYLMMVIGEHVMSTFMSTIMFVAVSAFHARIADPAIGGTYMTLLATYVFYPWTYIIQYAN
jgi:PAT family acetyl-CoA transporter-like MFS transporter 1